MDIFTFQNRFPDERACGTFLKNLRWPDTNFTCPECGSHDHADHELRQMSQCSNCGRQVYWKAGTLFEDSNLDLKTWFWGIYLMVESKKSISRLKLSRRLGVASSTASRMVNRIQAIMVDEQEDMTLEGVVKVDVGQFDSKYSGTYRKPYDREFPVFVSCEVHPDEQNHEKYDTPPLGRVTMVPTMDRTLETSASIFQERIETGASIKTDAGTNFQTIDPPDQEHEYVTLEHLSEEEIDDHFPWVHVLISNMKRLLLGTYHGVDPKYLNEYLSEFCFRLNNWSGGTIFDRFLECAVNTPLNWKTTINARTR